MVHEDEARTAHGALPPLRHLLGPDLLAPLRCLALLGDALHFLRSDVLKAPVRIQGLGREVVQHQRDMGRLLLPQVAPIQWRWVHLDLPHVFPEIDALGEVQAVFPGIIAHSLRPLLRAGAGLSSVAAKSLYSGPLRPGQRLESLMPLPYPDDAIRKRIELPRHLLRLRIVCGEALRCCAHAGAVVEVMRHLHVSRVWRRFRPLIKPQGLQPLASTVIHYLHGRGSTLGQPGPVLLPRAH
mmetsp:Transcript_129777/g.276958  ORF Transcript_129777/g.276958 Transcript_129777/m.276958 type:complete len:240 (-) Transcript_129777:377-1096(-)